MRKYLWIAVVAVFFLFEGGIILDDGLLLAEGQSEIVMNAGEKMYLKVQDYIWKYPLWQGLEFSSQRPYVAYVDRNGWVHAVLPGRTVISVWNEQGDNGTIEIVVRGKGKLALTGTLILLCAFLGCIAVLGDKNVLPFLTKIKNEFCAK